MVSEMVSGRAKYGNTKREVLILMTVRTWQIEYTQRQTRVLSTEARLIVWRDRRANHSHGEAK